MKGKTRKTFLWLQFFTTQSQIHHADKRKGQSKYVTVPEKYVEMSRYWHHLIACYMWVYICTLCNGDIVHWLSLTFKFFADYCLPHVLVDMVNLNAAFPFVSLHTHRRWFAAWLSKCKVKWSEYFFRTKAHRKTFTPLENWHFAKKFPCKNNLPTRPTPWIIKHTN